MNSEPVWLRERGHAQGLGRPMAGRQLVARHLVARRPVGARADVAFRPDGNTADGTAANASGRVPGVCNGAFTPARNEANASRGINPVAFDFV